MGYCWKCGNKIDDDMAFCPKCGATLHQQRQNSYGGDDKVIRTVGLAVVGILVAVAIIIVALLAVGFLPGFQSPFGSGHAQTVQYNITDFTSVSASHGFNVVITQGNSYSVKVTADDNLQQYINVYKDGNTLYVGLKPGTGFSFTQLKAEISMPDITTLQLSGGSVANAAGFNLTHNFNVDLSGGSRVSMTGEATDLTVTASGGSNVNLQDFQVTNAQIDLSGGSQCRVNLNGRLDATLSGGSQLHYQGNPTLGSINTSGGSSIAPMP